MKKLHLLHSLLAGAALLAVSNLNAATTSVVGYTSTTLPAGAGNLYAPAFVNNDSFVGTLTGVTPSETSTLTLSGTVAANAFNETQDDPGVSKGYPQYYVEVLNDTNASDSIDTEGLIIDIVSNTASTVEVDADISTLGIQGDERIAIRKHLTLGDLVSGGTGFNPFTELLTIYNEDGPGTIVSHLPNASLNGTVLSSDFVTSTSNAPVYPGHGIVVNNPNDVTIVPTGVVKETDTQVVIYGNSVVNIVGAMKPVTSLDLDADGRLNDALADFTDLNTIYTADGTLVPAKHNSSNGLQPSFLDSGTEFVSASDFVTPVTVTIDGTHQPIVINAASGSVYKLSGNDIF